MRLLFFWILALASKDIDPTTQVGGILPVEWEEKAPRIVNFMRIF
jgi:hypothetical protein